MKIGMRLGLGFGVIIVLLITMSITTITQMKTISGNLDQVVHDRFPKTISANNILDDVNVAARGLRNMLLLTDSTKIGEEQQRVLDVRKSVSEEFDLLKETVNTVEGKKILNDALDAREAYIPVQNQILKLLGEKKKDAAIALIFGDFRVHQNNYMGKITELINLVEELTNKEGETGLSAAKTAELTIYLLAGFILIFSIIAAIFITRSITSPISQCIDIADKVASGDTSIQIMSDSKDETGLLLSSLEKMVSSIKALVTDVNILSKAAVDGKLDTRADASKHQGDYRKIIVGVNDTLDAVITPVNEAASVLDKVANRDLTARMIGDYKGDLATIKKSLNLAVDNLDNALQQVSEAAEQVTSASNQISSGSQSLAQGANEQASSLEEVSSSLEEMASMTKQNADNATQAKSLSGESEQNTTTGTEAMERMSSAINKIKESSDQTAKIVKTIDEIAMQTNLLALNAAVEAARAGEAGRGFAVVAEEVRNLAQRSAQAAKNTADMISESVKNADDGVKIADEVSQSFESIATSTKKVNDLIAEIAAASQEQAQGIDQVNSAVAQMDKVTQQNAANSEESASAAEELSSQAEELKTMIDQFALSMASSQHKPASIRQDVKRETIAAATAHHLDIKGKKAAKKQTKTDTFLSLDDSALKDF